METDSLLRKISVYGLCWVGEMEIFGNKRFQRKILTLIDTANFIFKSLILEIFIAKNAKTITMFSFFILFCYTQQQVLKERFILLIMSTDKTRCQFFYYHKKL